MNEIDRVPFPLLPEETNRMRRICCEIMQRDYSLWPRKPAKKATPIMRMN